MENMEWAEEEARELREAGTAMQLNVLSTPQEPRSVVNGKLVINLCSNNYLGLTTHPRLKAAASEALERFGVGTGSVRSIAGTMALHEELEHKLATFKHTEAALVFQSGFACNSGIIPVLAGDGDVIITDELNHASIIDGIRLSKASRRIFLHADMNALEEALRESQGARRRLVVTDGVFSMDGDVAKLPEIVALAERFHAMVYVDDAHASGVFGQNGRGTVESFRPGRPGARAGGDAVEGDRSSRWICGFDSWLEGAADQPRPPLHILDFTPTRGNRCLYRRYRRTGSPSRC